MSDESAEDYARRRYEELVPKVLRFVEDAMKEDKWFACTNPGCKGKVHYPDVRGAVDALVKVRELAYGKPAAEKPRPEPPAESLDWSQLSDEELRAIAAGTRS